MHEVGHAVETKDHRAAIENKAKTAAELDAAEKRVKDPANAKTYDKDQADEVEASSNNARAGADVNNTIVDVENTKVGHDSLEGRREKAAAQRKSAADSLAVVKALKPSAVKSSAAYKKRDRRYERGHRSLRQGLSGRIVAYRRTRFNRGRTDQESRQGSPEAAHAGVTTSRDGSG